MIGIFKITEQGEKLVYKTEDPVQAREFYRRHANGHLRNGYGRYQKSLRYGRNNQSRNQRNQHYSQFRPIPKRNFRNV